MLRQLMKVLLCHCMTQDRYGEGLYVNHFVCLLGNLFSIPEKSNSFLRWLQSLAAYSCNTRKRVSYHPWPVPT